MARAPLRVGDPSRVGRYRLTARIGAGGMGVVYLGHARDGSQVAVKVLRPELADDPEFRMRFGREVTALMRVRGACTVRVIEADTEAPSPFMVTEYAEGPTLAEYLDTYGPLDPDMLYGLATGLAEALTAIHAAGVVHRDLKPSNVILGRDGPKVIDFGIAHVLDATKVTRTGMMVGSAGFMAPEQATGHAGQASDIFAWAVTVAHAATGRPPFGTGTAHAILYRIVYDEPDIALVPEALGPLVTAALAKDPRRRPTAHDLLDRLTKPVILSAPTTGGSVPSTSAQQVLTETWPTTEPNIGSRTRPEPPSPAPATDRPRTDRPRIDQPRIDQPRFTPSRSAGQPARSLLLEPGTKQPRTRRAPGRRRAALIAAPALAGAAVIAMLVSLMTGHGLYFGQLTASQLANPGNSATVLATYPGQQQRGVFQVIHRVIASGRTMVAIGSQTSDGLVRQQFFVSTDGGASWRLAPIHGPGGGQAPLGYEAELLAGGSGGPRGWLAVSSQSTWTSPDGTSWTLTATHGITPQLPGDAVWVITKTAQGYLAAGPGQGQAVIWTSRDGLAWQRLTAAQLGLAGPGETVQNIAYATYHGNATVISGQVTNGKATYSGTWLSTNGGSSWARVTIPADHGAGTQIGGLAFDAEGLIAVRPGVTANGAPDGVAYFSPNGLEWQYAGTIDPGGGWSPAVVKGSDDGFVVTGNTRTGKIVAYSSTGTGGTWQPTGSLGQNTAESVNGATVAPNGTVVAVGSTSRSSLSQQPVFVAADTAGNVRPIPVTGIPGAVVPELAVNGLAASDGQLLAVGSADGYPAIWHKAAGGSWSRVTPLSLVSSYTGVTALTSVTDGPAGWLAVGEPGSVVLASADGITWHRPGGNVPDLASAPAVTATSGPGGYVIAGEGLGGGTPQLWWSQGLTSWTSVSSMNDVSGSSQVLAVAADGHGFLAVGSHNHQPTIWTTSDGSDWTATVLGLPPGASSAVLQQVAVNGSHVVVLGQQRRAGGTAPLAEMSDNNLGWKIVPFGSPGPDTVLTALAPGPGTGFTAAGQYGPPGQQQAALWTSSNGTTWALSQLSTLTGGADSQIAALAPSGSSITAIATVSTPTAQRPVTVVTPPPT